MCLLFLWFRVNRNIWWMYGSISDQSIVESIVKLLTDLASVSQLYYIFLSFPHSCYWFNAWKILWIVHCFSSVYLKPVLYHLPRVWSVPRGWQQPRVPSLKQYLIWPSSLNRKESRSCVSTTIRYGKHWPVFVYWTKTMLRNYHRLNQGPTRTRFVWQLLASFAICSIYCVNLNLNIPPVAYAYFFMNALSNFCVIH